MSYKASGRRRYVTIAYKTLLRHMRLCAWRISSMFHRWTVLSGLLNYTLARKSRIKMNCFLWVRCSVSPPVYSQCDRSKTRMGKPERKNRTQYATDMWRVIRSVESFRIQETYTCTLAARQLTDVYATLIWLVAARHVTTSNGRLTALSTCLSWAGNARAHTHTRRTYTTSTVKLPSHGHNSLSLNKFVHVVTTIDA